MIPVHRIAGEQLFVNADLIESIEGSSVASGAGQARVNTVLTLVDGRKAVVSETPEQIVELIRRYRASIIVAAESQREASAAAPALRVVRADEG